MITLCYIEILYQLVFQIWFCVPYLHWGGGNFHARGNFVKLGINLQWILTPSPLRGKWIITTYDNLKI